MSMLDAALARRDEGWSVFPCVPGGKRPLVEHGFHEATRDTDQIVAWWTACPNANPATACGAVSDNMIAIDVDNKVGKNGKRGDVEMVRLVDERGPIPHTREIETPSGGAHLIYRLPAGVVLAPSQGKIATGIDVRPDGSYIVAEGARGPGGPYARLQNGAPVATLDGWLLAAAIGPDPTPAGPVGPPRGGRYGTDLDARVRRAVAYVDKIPGAIAGSGGHDQTWDVALRLVRGFELPPPVALEILSYYNSRCSPPWSAKELAHKVKQAVECARVAPGFLGAA